MQRLAAPPLDESVIEPIVPECNHFHHMSEMTEEQDEERHYFMQCAAVSVSHVMKYLSFLELHSIVYVSQREISVDDSYMSPHTRVVH